jgi:hypothetical protein
MHFALWLVVKNSKDSNNLIGQEQNFVLRAEDNAFQNTYMTTLFANFGAKSLVGGQTISMETQTLLERTNNWYILMGPYLVLSWGEFVSSHPAVMVWSCEGFVQIVERRMGSGWNFSTDAKPHQENTDDKHNHSPWPTLPKRTKSKFPSMQLAGGRKLQHISWSQKSR